MTMNKKLKDTVFIAFDVETTSLYDFSGRMVEIGAVKFDLPGTVYEEFSSLINPGIPIPEAVVAIHGISNEMVAKEKGAREVLQAFLAFTGTSDAVMIAHNASFDIGFISNDLVRGGLSIPQNRVVDTVSLAKKMFPEAGLYNLEHLVNFLHVDPAVSHRALGDALMAREVFLRCLERGNLLSEQDLLTSATVLSFEPSVDFTVEFPPGFEEICKAIEEGIKVKMNYSGGTKGKKVRTVTPLGLMGKNGVLYLSAFCHIDQYEKSFRLDRIEKFWIE
jgi:DNA polymerase III epsilon subunit family exonuclease